MTTTRKSHSYSTTPNKPGRKPLLAILLIATLLITRASATIEECLRGETGLTTNFPGTPEYETNRLSTNLRFNYLPVAVCLPSTPEQVQAIVRCANQYNVNVAPRAGGHDYEGFSQGGRDGAVLIDLRNMNEVTVNASEMSAIVGPGNRLGKLYVDLWDAGEYAFPGGSCPSVGVSGFLLGGGWGFLSSELGLGADQILEMKVVTGNGDLLTVNENEHPDLFWALRGAGHGGFGVVVEFKLRIARVSPVATHFYVTYPLPGNGVRLLAPFSRWQTNNPSRMTAGAGFGHAGGRNIAFYGIYLGPETEARELLGQLYSEIGGEGPADEFFTEGTLINAHLRMSEYESDYSGLADLANDRADRYWKSSGIFHSELLTASTINIMDRYIAQGDLFVEIEYMGGANSAVSRVATDYNAFVHRDQLYHLQVFAPWGAWNSTIGLPECTACIELQESLIRELIEDHRTLYPNKPIRAYQNYPDTTFANWPEAYYGDGVEKLSAVKAVYDAEDVFAFPQSIPVGDPSYLDKDTEKPSGSTSDARQLAVGVFAVVCAIAAITV